MHPKVLRVIIFTCTDARDLPRILWSVNLRVVRRCGFGFGLQMAALGRAWTVRGWIRQSTETRSWFRYSSPSNHCPCNGSLRTSGAWKITTVINYLSSSGSPLKTTSSQKSRSEVKALSGHKSRKNINWVYLDPTLPAKTELASMMKLNLSLKPSAVPLKYWATTLCWDDQSLVV